MTLNKDIQENTSNGPVYTELPTAIFFYIRRVERFSPTPNFPPAD